MIDFFRAHVVGDASAQVTEAERSLSEAEKELIGVHERVAEAWQALRQCGMQRFLDGSRSSDVTIVCVRSWVRDLRLSRGRGSASLGACGCAAVLTVRGHSLHKWHVIAAASSR